MEETLNNLILSQEFQNWAKCMYGEHTTRRYLVQCIPDSWKQWLSEMKEIKPAHIETFLECIRERNISTLFMFKENITCKHSMCQMLFQRLYRLLNITDESNETTKKILTCLINQEHKEQHISSNEAKHEGSQCFQNCSDFAFDIAVLFVRFEGNESSKKKTFDDCSFSELMQMMQNCRLFSFAGSQNVYEKIQRKRQTIVCSRVNKENKTNAQEHFLTLEDLFKNLRKGQEVMEILKKVQNVTFEGTEYLRFAKGCLQMKKSALKETYTTGVCEDKLILGEIVLLESQIDNLLMLDEDDDPSELQQTILCLREENRKLKESHTNQQNQIKALLEQLELNQNRKSENELKQTEHVQEQLTELKKELENLTEQNEANILALEEKEKDIHNEKDKNSKIMSENEKVEAEKCIMEIQLEQSKRQFDETVSNFEFQLKTKETELTEVREEVSELHTELKEQIMQNNDQLKASALLESHHTALIKVNKDLTDQNSAQGLALQNERNINTKMKRELQNLESKKCKLELQLQQDKSDFEKSRGYFEFQLKVKETELIKRRKEVLKLEQDCTELKDQNDKKAFAATQVDELNRQNGILQRRYQVIEDQLKQNERQMVTVKRENENLIKENQTWTRMKEKYREQNAFYEEKEIESRIFKILSASQSEFRQILDNAQTDNSNTVLTTKLPDDWSPMRYNKKVEMVVLQPSDLAYKAITTRFMMEVNTGRFAGRLNYLMKNIEIRKIERIQNKTLYQQYMAMKNKMTELNPNLPANMPLEREMWHGTKYGAATSITLHGFNRSYSGDSNGKCWYGDGVYFARDASYSARTWFSGADTETVGYVFLAKTLTGRFCKGEKGMKYLPAVDPIGDPKILYDSAVNDPDDPIEFVIFNDTQAYPAYLITINAELIERRRKEKKEKKLKDKHYPDSD